MISEIDKQRLGQVTNLTHYWGGSPFVWDFKEDRLRVATSKFGLFKYFWTAYWIFLYGWYLAFRCLESVLSSRPIHEYILCILIFAAGTIVGLVFYEFAAKEKEILIFVNSSLRLSQWFDDEYGKKTVHKEPEIIIWISRLLGMLIVNCRVFGFIVGLISLSRPYDIIFPASTLPEEFRSPWFALIQGLIAIWWIFAAAGAGSSMITWMLVLAIGFIQAQTETNLKNRTFWTKSCLRTPVGLKKTFDTVSIGFQLFENFSRDMIMPHQMIMTRVVHFCNFIVIRHHNQLPWMDLFTCLGLSFTLTVLWLGMMYSAAFIYKTTARDIVTWKDCPVRDKRDKLIWKKVRKVIRPFGIKVGDFYVMKHNSVMAMASTFIYGTMRMLLTFR